MKTAPYSWIKRIEGSVKASQEIPLWGNIPSFPWQEFSERLSKIFYSDDLTISHHATEWLSSEQMLNGMGSDPVILHIELSPLKETALWIMPREDIAKVTSYLLSSNHSSKGFFDPRLQEGFYRYLMLEAATGLDEMDPFKGLSIKIGSKTSKTEAALCTDVRIVFTPHYTLWGRLACEEVFLRAFKSYFAKETISFSSGEMPSLIPLSLRLEVGSATLSAKEWSHVKQGDLILLDNCSYDPNTHKGTLTLSLEKTPLLKARLKEQTVTILDYMLYHEDDMDTEHPEEEESFEEEDFDDEEEDLAEEELSKEEEEESAAEEEIISSAEISITITVEVAKLKMPLQQLLQLRPGNTIELTARPEQAVRLTVDGKTVAKAELIKIGELLGVKILQMGTP